MIDADVQLLERIKLILDYPKDKIEDYPFTGRVMEVNESYVKRFIRENKLKEVEECLTT